MPIQKNTNQKSTARPAPKPLKNAGSGGKISANFKKSSAVQKSGKNASNGESVNLTNESKALLNKGTEGSDRLSANGQLPNLLAAFGGDDTIKVRGQGDTKINAGDGDDIVDIAGEGKGSVKAEVDGGKGNDALFVGQEMGPGGNFHVRDEKGKTIAKKGEGGHQIQTKDVESVFAANTVNGTKGDDNIKSDFGGNSDVKLGETHNIASGEGNDTIDVATGDKGNSEVSLLPGPGNNTVNFKGGGADDKVYYSSERDWEPNAEGSDTLNLSGGEGNDQLNINSQNYSLVDKEGKVLSKLGEGKDRISADGFEQVWINGEPLNKKK